jgi:hypothetical protein
LRYYIAERAQDLPAEQQRRRVADFIGDEGKVDSAIRGLERDPAALEEVVLFVLSQAWEELGQAELIAGAASDAKAKLPVVETTILATVAMYGMYLLATGGIKQTKTTTVRGKNGRYSTSIATDYVGFAEPVKALATLLKIAPRDDAPKGGRDEAG